MTHISQNTVRREAVTTPDLALSHYHFDPAYFELGNCGKKNYHGMTSNDLHRVSMRAKSLRSACKEVKSGPTWKG